MKQFSAVRRGAFLAAAVVASLIAIPASSAMASTSADASAGSGSTGTYVSTTGSTLLGLSLPVLSTTSTTLPVALPVDFNTDVNLGVGGLSLLNLNLDPHMVH